MATQALFLAAALCVLIVWLVAALWGMVTGQYEALQLVTPVMLILAGALFAKDYIIRVRNGTSNGGGSNGRKSE